MGDDVSGLEGREPVEEVRYGTERISAILEDVGDGGVQRGASMRRDDADRGLAHEVVHEHERALVVDAQDAPVDGGIQGRHDAVATDSRSLVVSTGTSTRRPTSAATPMTATSSGAR